jgi:hypothetical protein
MSCLLYMSINLFDTPVVSHWQTLSHNVVSSQYTSLLEGFKLKMLVVIGTNCIGSSLAECNSQYCNDYKHAKWLFFFRLAIIHKAVWNKLICFYLSFSKLMWTGIVSFCCPMLRTDWWTYKVNMTCIWLTFTNNLVVEPTIINDQIIVDISILVWIG